MFLHHWCIFRRGHPRIKHNQHYHKHSILPPGRRQWNRCWSSIRCRGLHHRMCLRIFHYRHHHHQRRWKDHQDHHHCSRCYQWCQERNQPTALQWCFFIRCLHPWQSPGWFIRRHVRFVGEWTVSSMCFLTLPSASLGGRSPRQETHPPHHHLLHFSHVQFSLSLSSNDTKIRSIYKPIYIHIFFSFLTNSTNGGMGSYIYLHNY